MEISQLDPKVAFARYFGQPKGPNSVETWRDKDYNDFTDSLRLPIGYHGKNTHLQKTFAESLKHKQAGNLLEIAPITETDRKLITMSEIHFDNYLMENAPPDGSPPLIEIGTSNNTYMLKSAILGGKIARGFHLTPDGERIFAEVFRVLGEAALYTMLHEAILRFYLNSNNYRIAFVQKTQQISSDYAALVAEGFKTWGLFNKNLDYIHEILKNAQTIMADKAHATPKYILVPKGGLDHLPYRPEERKYDNRGPDATKAIREGADMYREISNMKCIEMTDFSSFKSVNGRPINPVYSIREYGSYWVLTDFCGEHTKYVSINNFATKIPMMQSQAGNMVTVTGKEALDYCFVFHKDGTLDKGRHKQVIDDGAEAAKKLNMGNHYYNDMLTISHLSKGWKRDASGKKAELRPIQHIGEMQPHHLPEELLTNMVTCCENHFSHLIEKKSGLLNEFTNFIQLLNTCQFTSGSDEEWWLAAVILSFEAGYENHHLLSDDRSRIPNLPYVGETGLYIKKETGEIVYVVRQTDQTTGNTEFSATTESNLEEINNNNSPKYLRKIMKPIGMGTAAGLAILDQMYKTDNRGYDKNLLQKASELHAVMTECYSIFKEIFSNHELIKAHLAPRYFSSHLNIEDKYIAFMSNLCLPLQMGIHTSKTTGNKLRKSDAQTFDLYIALAVDSSCLTANTSRIVRGTNAAHMNASNLDTAIGGSKYDSMYFLQSSIYMKSIRRLSNLTERTEFNSMETMYVDQPIMPLEATKALLAKAADNREEGNVGIYHINTFKLFEKHKHKKNFLKRMLTLGIITQRFEKQTFINFWDKNIVLPFSFTLDRPRQHMIMGDVILVDPGANNNNAETLFTSADMSMGEDVTRFEYLIKTALYCGTVIHNTNLLFKLMNAMCLGYKFGGNVTFAKVDRDVNSLKNNHTNNTPDIVVRMIPYVKGTDVERLPRVRDISGIWSPMAKYITGTEPEGGDKCSIQNAVYYETLFDLTNFAFPENEVNCCDPFDALLGKDQPNTIVFKGLQYIYNTTSGRWDSVIRDEGPFHLSNGWNNTLQCVTRVETKLPDGAIEY